ncbi:MAG: polyprenol monophosphomannose synthase, partial [Chloroflexota bacterium]
SWWANTIYTQLILGIKVKDATAGFKCWKSGTLRGMGLDRVRSNGYVFQVEMAYLTEKLGYMVTEIPIYFEDRRVGKSKMTAGVKWEAVWRVWEIKLRHRGMSPSKRRLSR